MTINLANNARTRLVGNLGPGSDFFYCLPGEGNIFPENNFIVTFEEKIGSEIVKRMVVKVARREGDKFYVSELSSEPCVQNDTLNPKISSKNILNFSAGAYISMYITAEMYKFIESNLNGGGAKLDGGNTFNGEQRFTGGFNTRTDNPINNWLNFWLENNQNRIDSYNSQTSTFQDLYFRAKNTIFESGNVGIGKNNPTEKLDIAGGIAFDNTFWLRYNNHNRLRLNQYDGGSGERRIYFEVFDQNGNNVGIPLEFDNFANGEGTRRIKLQFLLKLVNIPSSPNGLSSGDVYRDGDLLKIIP